MDIVGGIIAIIIVILGIIGRAAKASPGPTSGPPRPIPPPMAPPTTFPKPTAPPTAPPTTIPRPATASQSMAVLPRQMGQTPPPRPAAQQKFRPQAAPQGRQAAPAPGSSSQQMAQDRADVERFVQEEKELEAGEPSALGVSLTSPTASGPPPSPLFANEGAIPGAGANSNLLRAIMLAQALGPPRAKTMRGRDSTA